MLVGAWAGSENNGASEGGRGGWAMGTAGQARGGRAGPGDGAVGSVEEWRRVSRCWGRVQRCQWKAAWPLVGGPTTSPGGAGRLACFALLGCVACLLALPCLACFASKPVPAWVPGGGPCIQPAGQPASRPASQHARWRSREQRATVAWPCQPRPPRQRARTFWP